MYCELFDNRTTILCRIWCKILQSNWKLHWGATALRSILKTCKRFRNKFLEVLSSLFIKNSTSNKIHCKSFNLFIFTFSTLSKFLPKGRFNILRLKWDLSCFWKGLIQSEGEKVYFKFEILRLCKVDLWNNDLRNYEKTAYDLRKLGHKKFRYWAVLGI